MNQFKSTEVIGIARSGLFRCVPKGEGYCNVCTGGDRRCPRKALMAFAEILSEQEKEITDARKILRDFNTMMCFSTEELNARFASTMIACNQFFCTYPGKPFVIKG